MPQTLAQMVRAKYPGAYDDLNDQQLEQAVRAKFPGVYDDLPSTPAPSSAPASKTRGALDTAVDVAKGVAKGAGSTAFGLGKIVHDYTPIGRISDAIQPGAFNERPPEIVPSNNAQRAGFMGEQLGEFFVPASKAAKLPRLAEAGKAALTTLAQTGSPTNAGVSGALAAAMPGGRALSTAANALEESANKSAAQALGATKEWAKDTAAKVAPGMIRRGVKGARAAMFEQAKQQVTALGQKIGAEIQAVAAQGSTVSGNVIRADIAQAQRSLTTTTAGQQIVPIPGTEAVVARLQKLDQFVESLGPNIAFDKAAKVKQVWDRIVSKAGLYNQKAGASATDNAAAWATREGAGAFRKLIDEGSPNLKALNEEYQFWRGVRDVLKETQRRTQAQGGGLSSAITGAAGAGAGFASGDSIGDRFQKALVGGVMGRQIVKVVQSPAFRTRVSAPLKQSLADALASGSESRVYGALSRIVSAMPAQLRPASVQ